jgi:hypothetical protein
MSVVDQIKRLAAVGEQAVDRIADVRLGSELYGQPTSDGANFPPPC